MTKRTYQSNKTSRDTVKKKRSSQLSEIEDIQHKTQQILANQENINQLVDILNYCQSSDNNQTINAAIVGLSKLFSHFIANGDCMISQNLNENFESKDDDEDNRNCSKIYNSWMHKQYLTCQRCFIGFVHNADVNIQELALTALMTFVSDEFIAKQATTHSDHVFEFPNMLFYRIVEALLSSDKTDEKILIKKFNRFLKYNDVTYYTLKNIGTLTALKHSEADRPMSEILVENTFYLLRSIKLVNNSEEISSFFLTRVPAVIRSVGIFIQNSVNDDFYGKLKDHGAYKKVFSKAWLNFLRLKLPSKIYKKALAILHTEVMPNMLNPKLLIDFLADSYNLGGAISLLALNGLFILIHEHNLDYPDFYKKLYALVDTSVFVAKSSPRFFYLLDLFLTSTHLPTYVVAAFAKKLCRIALLLNPAGAIVAITFVCNLIKRHSSIKILIHRSLDENSSKILGDPYLMDEDDPAKCKAMESSLWELQTLMEHYYPKVTSLAELFKKPITSTETDISDSTDQTFKTILEKELNSKVPENVALEFKVPIGLIPTDSETWKFWSYSDRKKVS